MTTSDPDTYFYKREKARATTKQGQKANPGKVKVHYQTRRTRKTQAGGTFTGEQWDLLLDFYGHICLCCGIPDSETTLEIDHIIPVVKRGTSNIDNLQPLCKTCNMKKFNQTIDYRYDTGKEFLQLFDQ